MRALLVAILCVTLPLTACQTMRPVDFTSSSKPLSDQFAPNDFVKVWMHDGRVVEAQLTAVEPDALVAGKQRFPISEIDRVERREFSLGRTALLVVGILAAMAGALAGWFATHPAPL